MRTKLTNLEWNTLLKYSRKIGVDQVIDVCEINRYSDGFFDYEDDRIISLPEGLYILYDATVYPADHCGMSPEETEILHKLFTEFLDFTKEEILHKLY